MSLRRLSRAVAAILPRSFPRRFGCLEVLHQVEFGSVEWTNRHIEILNRIEPVRKTLERPIRVLDFGGGGGALCRVLRSYKLTRHYRVVVSEVIFGVLALARPRPPCAGRVLTGTSGGLPFTDGSFDIVVSCDVFEHIPPGLRGHWATECSRVSRFGYVHTMPCDGPEEGFTASAVDTEFMAWYERTFCEPERYTREHFANGHPRIGEVRDLFPGAEVRGFANSDVWLAILRDQFQARSRWERLRAGMSYRLRLAARNAAPPYKSCVVSKLARETP